MAKLFEKIDDNPGEYFGMLAEGFEDKEESLKEDKFVSRDKMSKKDRKELDSKKRNTWGNTNPVTKVQSNKKAYDRKRDKKELDESSKEHFLDGWEMSDFIYVFDRFDLTMSVAKDFIKRGWVSEEDIDDMINDFRKAANTLEKIKKDKSI